MRGASVDLRRLSAASSSTPASTSNKSNSANDGGSEGKGNTRLWRGRSASFEGHPDDMVINIEDLMLDWDESDDDEDGDEDEEDTSTDLQ